ncbi:MULTISPECIES: YchJ family protein [unclassified Oceanobacter]|uniref:YchJ family protein n=1 Tax=unclassified Oceanobacter TaxID=2620260 RepID=UPI0026E249DD|nr:MULTISPECIES: YchJ family protein [unclassified Oceanobacter]MDO6681813.1 YchJ family protein [Oceanobacter sp. 5_MG-2023]MDP2506587.1 YchJ family protein [Oceanobacter sp. 3_MG-2023]MDP2548966.1 YchJ family protein [Oceanobacter sp. 4_MG-2023]MDP2609650.1 YchJ family protein [Oceanobacter sp. 1_MG-2023]MDP2613368.1 YchJ family protein [Oceanobacter sp. 2_MG-2023]
MTPDSPCPCGRMLAASSVVNYGDCCQPLHLGQPAASAEALMRSRYSAFVLELEDYLQASWHPDTRPDGPVCEASMRWYGLDIESADELGDPATVCFTATFRAYGRWQTLHECSRFVKQGEHWRYYDGEAEWQQLQPGRNDPCPCGSGKKFKKCCA